MERATLTGVVARGPWPGCTTGSVKVQHGGAPMGGRRLGALRARGVVGLCCHPREDGECGGAGPDDEFVLGGLQFVAESAVDEAEDGADCRYGGCAGLPGRERGCVVVLPWRLRSKGEHMFDESGQHLHGLHSASGDGTACGVDRGEEAEVNARLATETSFDAFVDLDQALADDEAGIPAQRDAFHIGDRPEPARRRSHRRGHHARTAAPPRRRAVTRTQALSQFRCERAQLVSDVTADARGRRFLLGGRRGVVGAGAGEIRLRTRPADLFCGRSCAAGSLPHRSARSASMRSACPAGRRWETWNGTGRRVLRP